MNGKPIEILKAIKNPQQFVENYMKQNNNPILNNLITQAKNGDTQALENFANNMLKEKGMNLQDIIQLIK